MATSTPDYPRQNSEGVGYRDIIGEFPYQERVTMTPFRCREYEDGVRVITYISDVDEGVRQLVYDTAKGWDAEHLWTWSTGSGHAYRKWSLGVRSTP